MKTFQLWGVFGLMVTLFGLIATLTAVAHAHADLVSATPAPGSTVRNPVGSIRLTFSEALTSDSAIILFKDDFQPVRGISAQVDEAMPSRLMTAVPALAAGLYTVQWTAVSIDGHKISGSYAFRVSAATFLPVPLRQLWLSGLSLLFIGALVVLWQRSRHRPSVTDKP